MTLSTILPMLNHRMRRSAAAFLVSPNKTTRCFSGSGNLETLKKKTQGVADVASKRAKEELESLKAKALDAKDSLTKKAEGAADSAKDKMESAKDAATEKTKDFLDSTKEAIDKK